jgi:predicted acetyltransferase
VTAPHLTQPIDETSRTRLASAGLTFRLVDPSDATDFVPWSDAMTRGFYGPTEPPADTEAQRAHHLDDRLTGVYDPTSATPEQPVATTHCWPADLTLPGDRTVPAWAVSGVTVAQTHRRRGLARALMEAELRTAVALGCPVAMLTVSESTIYARFGYSPAALARLLTISTRRARWIGPETTGRVQYVSAEQLRHEGFAIVERVRPTVPGEVSYSGTGHLWLRRLGLSGRDDNAKNLRFVRHDDENGTAQGFAIFQLVENEADFAEHELKLHALVAATPAAYASLWRFLLEMDLVSTITAYMRPVDEPLRWMIDDFRAIHVDERDHLWVRVLDVPAALSGRTYATPDRIVLAVDDPLGHAEGTWALDIDPDGHATVTPVDEPADVSMTVNALGSLLLGGVRASPRARCTATPDGSTRCSGHPSSPS